MDGGTFRHLGSFTVMTRKPDLSRMTLFAAAAAITAATCADAQAASETTRRNAATIQTYQNQKQTPYYSGQTNPYYGANSQTPPPQNPSSANTLTNQLRDNDRRSNGR